MKAVILAGGFGTRLGEETVLKPKPMVEVGGRPILWHIMKTYETHGIVDFVICCGYKSYVIKEYFHNYFLHQSDVTFRLGDNEVQFHDSRTEPWNVTLVDTGDNSMTGGRLLAVKDYVANEECFCFTYGDGVIDSDISESIRFHKAHGKAASVTAAYPPARFGALEFDGDTVVSFKEKPAGDRAMVNAGYFVLTPKVFDFIEGPSTVWEQEPLIELAAENQLMAYKHTGFWQPMDTLADKKTLEDFWQSGNAPWWKWD